MNEKALCTARELAIGYGKTPLLSDICLGVQPGQILTLIGPNGAGKSTTMKMLLGLVKPTQGTVHLFGKQMNDKNRVEILRQTGALIESPSYYGHLTGMENLRVMQKLLDKLNLVSRENRSQIPDTVVGESSRDRSFAPSVSKARSGRIPLVGSNIASFSYRKVRGRLFEDVT